MKLPVGNASAHAAFLAAMTSGAMHHAWLFSGPEGVGKATFARIAALRLLAEAAHPGKFEPGFDVPEPDQTRTLIQAGSHPDYRELVRLPKDSEKPDGDLARSITIAQVRGLMPMFATKPSMSPVRIILIDAVDDLERPGASNALLKNLEEPPAGTIFILVSHAPGRLLPTIRSRCRRLRFDPLDDEEMRLVLARQLPDAPETEMAAMIAASAGSPGRAISYLGLGMADLGSVMTSLAGTGDVNNKIRTSLAKSLAAKSSQARYEAFLDLAPSFIAAQAELREGQALSTALDAYDTARALAASARALSLDQQATVYEMAGIVARLAPTA